MTCFCDIRKKELQGLFTACGLNWFDVSGWILRFHKILQTEPRNPQKTEEKNMFVKQKLRP